MRGMKSARRDSVAGLVGNCQSYADWEINLANFHKTKDKCCRRKQKDNENLEVENHQNRKTSFIS